jgi:O-methyltransferase
MTVQSPPPQQSLSRKLRNAIRFKVRTQKLAARIFDLVLYKVVPPYHQNVFWGDRLLTLDKTAGFLATPGFQAALAQADSSTGRNQYRSPQGITWRYNTLIWAARTCLAVPGDFVECGVYRGDMTWMVTEMVDLRGANKKFYLYDTFTGFAAQYSSEADFPGAPQYLEHIDKEYKAADIEGYVRDRFRAKDYVVVTKGVVPDVLHEIAPERIAFLHLDMNSPRAETGALEVLLDRVSPGGIVIFDDYGWKHFQSHKEATDKFMAERGQVILELPTGQGLMIKR